MNEKKPVRKKEVKITHTMADGRILSSIDGYEIPYNDTTKIIYDMIAYSLSVKK